MEAVAEVILLEAVEEVAVVANLSFDKSNCLNKIIMKKFLFLVSLSVATQISAQTPEDA